MIEAASASKVTFQKISERSENMARKCNFPTAHEPDLTPSEMGVAVGLFDQMRQLPPVRKADPQGIQARLDDFFRLCSESGLKPTVESMTLCLGISRESAWRWQQEGGEAGILIDRAKSLINAFLTDCAVSGKVNPVYVIWTQKNNFHYSDSITITPPQDNFQTHPQISAEEVLRLREERRALPEKPNLDDPTE